MHQPVVLLVDDDPRVLSALRRGLRREPICIETAANGREALERLDGDAIDLVISDQKMPGLSGIELLKAIRSRWPETQRILLSGWTSEIDKVDLDAAGLSCVIAKPWDDDELRRSIRRAVGIDS
jgi:two-component system response regulator HupR/HoxA